MGKGGTPSPDKRARQGLDDQSTMPGETINLLHRNNSLYCIGQPFKQDQGAANKRVWKLVAMRSLHLGQGNCILYCSATQVPVLQARMPLRQRAEVLVPRCLRVLHQTGSCRTCLLLKGCSKALVQNHQLPAKPQCLLAPTCRSCMLRKLTRCVYHPSVIHA